MKINVDIDCTPIEARTFLGLPDLTPVHETYIRLLTDNMGQMGSPEQIETLMRSFAPMGEASMNLFRQMFQLGTAGMTGGSGSGGKK